MPLPMWTDKKSVKGRNTSTFSGQGLMIYKKTKKVDAAWKFMKFVMEDRDANVERYLQGNAFTAFQPAWADLRFSQKDSTFKGQSIGNLMLELAPNIPAQSQSPLRAYVINLLREKYFPQVISGTLSPKEALAQLKKEVTSK